MADKALVEYIKHVKKGGHPDHVIKEHLKKHGYPEHLIDNAYESLNRKYDFIFYIMAGLVVLMIILVGYSGIRAIAESPLFKSDPAIWCENTSIELYRYRDSDIICTSSPENVKVQFLISNNGTDKIEKVKYRVEGTKKSTTMDDATPDLISASGYAKSYDHPVPKYGDIKSIQIIPVIRKKNKDRLCENKAIMIDDFSSCVHYG